MTTHTYDADGNRILLNTGGQLTSYTWAGENRLLSLALPGSGGFETYTYGAGGLRRSLVNLSETTLFVWDGQNVLLQTNGSGATQAHSTDSPGYWDGLVSMRGGASSRYFALDPSQNTRVLTDVNGNITSTYVYTAFGDEMA